MFHQKIILTFLLYIVYNVTESLGDGDSLLTDDPKIDYLHVSTNVSNRYATTLVTCRMKNPSAVGKEATFTVVLPEKAFISNFVIEINNKSYQSYVKEKGEAQKIYDTAVQQGQAAAQVKVNARDSTKFSVTINLQPEEPVAFYLTYEELLVRKLGKYELVLNIFPGQPVDNLQIEVAINDTQPLKFVNPPILRQANTLKGKQESTDARLSKLDTSALVQYNPDVNEQRRIAKSWETEEKYGLAGQFVLQYDVEREANGGQVLQSKNNFAHFFSPVTARKIPKYVVFVLDTSASMLGNKLDQLRQAMKDIFNNLDSGDYFNIVDFSSTARAWDVETGQITYHEEPADSYDLESYKANFSANFIPKYHAATEANKEKAIQILKLFEPYGGTDIFAALKVGLMLLSKNRAILAKTQPIILFLTDGEVNRGIQDYNQIINHITRLNQFKVSIFTLSLGLAVNKNFLNRLSLINRGNTKHIYESEDISLQIENFFQEISSPQLKDVKFSYGSNVGELTKDEFPTAYAGGELVVVGRKEENVDLRNSTQISVDATSSEGKVQLAPSVETISENMEKLWAYLKVRQLLEQRKIVEDATAITKRALDLALKYSFVTEITSLVVVKPEETKVVETKAVEDGTFKPAQASTSYFSGRFKFQVASDSFTTTTTTTTTESSIPSTTTPVPELEDPEAIERINKVKQEIPWLSENLGKNGVLSTKSGPYQLDFITKKTIKPDDCQYVGNGTGTCVRMHECQHNYNTYTDEQYLSKLLCPLWYKFYWGVCCSSL